MGQQPLPQSGKDHLDQIVAFGLVDIDLRWGVTQAQAENDRVLDLCLSQIGGCRPFFIGLLGERYGWVPARASAAALRRYGWLRSQRSRLADRG